MTRVTEPLGCRRLRLSRLGCSWLLAIAGGAGTFGQYWGGRFRVSEEVRTAREIPTRSVDTPMWENPRAFEQDVFTFARLRYGTDGWRGGVGGGSWSTDLPDADLNLSYRLQQMTSLKVDPRGRIIRANDPELLNYFHAFAEGMAYPLAINIIFYVMTH